MAIYKYKVWCPEDGQTENDARTFKSFDHEGAAEAWAYWYDEYGADFSIIRGETPTVQVLREDETAPRSVLVTGETIRTYSGRVS